MHISVWRLALLVALGMSPVSRAVAADDARASFVDANVLSTFYHELGHALIDVLDLPVLGQEEDAADVLSIVLTEALWEEDTALSIADATALVFLAFDAEREEEDGEVPWWDVHGPDLQRYYTTVCLTFGAAPETRADFADEAGLPEDRGDGCPEEWDQAQLSWWTFLEDIEGAGDGLTLEVDEDDALAALLRDEVEALNARFSLPVPVTVALEPCGEANAFYDPEARRITICQEYADEMGAIFDAAAWDGSR